MNSRFFTRIILMAVLLLCLTALFATAQEAPREAGSGQAASCSPLGSGGPDSFGYTYRDSSQLDGPSYSWVEISASGNSIVFGYDSVHGPKSVGFPFNFYGTDYTELWVSSEGYVSFLPGIVDFTNDCPLPSAYGQEALIAALWNDHGPDGGPYGSGYYQSFAAGDCPYPTYDGACMVVEWLDVPLLINASDTQTFEVILLDNGGILVQIQDAGTEQGASATTGIENADASDGLTYGCFTEGYLRDGRAIGFYYPQPYLAWSRKMATPKVELGDPIQYAVGIVNTGNQPAASATLTDVLPAGTTLVPGSLDCTEGTCWYDSGTKTVHWAGEVGRAPVGEARSEPGTLLTSSAARNEVLAPGTETSSVPHRIIPAAAPPGTVLGTFANAWDAGGEGLVYDPSRDLARYAHEAFTIAGIWDVDYATHAALGSYLLSAVNAGWPVGLDYRNGIAYDPGADHYFMTDFQGDLTAADDNLIEIAPDGTILNAWEMDDGVGSNDSYDGSAIPGILDVAVVPGTPPRYFVTALGDGSTVYEVDLIKTGTWWTRDTWGTVFTCTVPGLVDNAGIDYDAEHGLLYHSDWSSTAIVATDLACRVVDAFACESAIGANSGVTYIEGKSGAEIWVTNDADNVTTRCAAPEIPSCETVALFSDDFEGGLGNWTATGLWNEEHEADACGSLVAPFPSPDTGAYYGQDGICNFEISPYSGELEMTFDVDLTGYSHASLNFWSYEATECGGGNCGFDQRYVDVSTNGGADWTTIWASTGPEATWYEASANLWGYVGGPVRLRFRFDAMDGAHNDYFGWLVDDVELVACPPPIWVTFAAQAPAWCGPVVNHATIADPEAGPVTVQATTVVVEEIYQAWNFETDGGGFIRELPGEWEWGVPTYPPGLGAHSGSKVWGTDLHGEADGEISPHRLAQTLALPSHPNGIVLEWWDWNGAESGDCINVAVDGTPVYQRCDLDQRAWTHHAVDISAWAGQTVEIAFELETDGNNPGPDGWTIDDVSIHAPCVSIYLPAVLKNFNP